MQAEHVRAVEGGCEITLIADGMHCAACAWLIDNALAREPGVREATANAMTGRLRLVWDPAATRLSQPLQRRRRRIASPSSDARVSTTVVSW